MELILLQKVTNLGNLGDKVNVKPGYGRNFLVPQGKAVPATAANVAEFEAKRAEYEAKASEALTGAEGRKAKLEGASVTIYANASTEGKLYGSVGPREIADALTKAGTPVEKSEVVLGEGAFRHIGEYEALLHLHADVETAGKVLSFGYFSLLAPAVLALRAGFAVRAFGAVHQQRKVTRRQAKALRQKDNRPVPAVLEDRVAGNSV